MHMLKVIVAGLLICAAILLLSKLWTTDKPLTVPALGIFLVIWFVISVVNLWIGVYRAGYSFGEELPILAAVFSVPAIASLVAAWLLMRG
ncbi:hypothetical protein DXT91_09740 [Agrobacterium tumefaciens]|uniref:hypothetical protein n=1 Tax=Agrobacterium tumefaciens TaxID=358 RepID=UPI0012B85AF3|nr:hypothetical protein [Agrobacterium tumefaciens]MQB04416.1 hypothetical protein [Agrobacterium tumefaciens]